MNSVLLGADAVVEMPADTHLVRRPTCTSTGIARIVAFTEPGLSPAFGLPQELPTP